MDIAVSSVASTSVEIAVSNAPAGATAIEVQFGGRPDFLWEISPIVAAVPGATILLAGLNQVARYFIRARPIVAGYPQAWSNVVGAFTPLAAARDVAPAAVMIEPALIVPPEPVLTWAASSEINGHPARALGWDNPNSTWVAKKAGGLVSFDANISGAPVDTIAVLESTAAEDCTITVRAAASQAGLGADGAVVVPARAFRASANLPGRRGYHALVRLDAPVAAAWWRVEVRGTMPADTFVATYAVLGLAHKTKNFATDSKTETLLDQGTFERDRSGNPSRADGFRGRTVDFEIQQMTERQYETEFERLRWRIGTTEAALVVPNSKPGAFLHDRILYGQMTAGRATNPTSPRFGQEFSVRSLI